MLAMTLKEFRQVVRDHRTLAMLIVMPVVLLLVFGYAASFDVDVIPTAVVGPGATNVPEQLPELFDVETADADATRANAEEMLRAGEVNLAVVTGDGPPVVLLDGSELFMARAAVQILAAAPIPGLDYVVLFNPELDTSAVLVPGLAGLIIVFVGTLVTSMSVVRERETGTLEQLAVMPFRPRDVFMGKIAPYFLIASIDIVIVLTIGTLLFDVPLNGSVLPLIVGALAFLFVALGVGVLISSVSENQAQAIQLALMTALPQIMLSGIIFPLSSMAPAVRWIGYLLPLTYFNQVAKGVMLRGAGLGDLLMPLALLVALGAVIFTLAVTRFRSQLRPARVRAAT
ncbi:MAG TPA: ABC transporter permease [Acidimicrobiia bacterium]|jgi:ABC-2 type transport system permease protein|nr:ABC transporter permease [Acidimicrobiia bacterium]